MVREIQGYKWNNINGSNSARQIAKNFYGYPTAPENITQEAFEVKHNEGSEGDFYYYEGSLEPLGNMTTFTINENEDNV